MVEFFVADFSEVIAPASKDSGCISDDFVVFVLDIFDLANVLGGECWPADRSSFPLLVCLTQCRAGHNGPLSLLPWFVLPWI